MAYGAATLVVSTGGSVTNVSYSLQTSSYQDAVLAVQNGMKNGGFWIQNTAAGVVYNQFIPSTAVIGITLT